MNKYKNNYQPFRFCAENADQIWKKAAKIFITNKETIQQESRCGLTSELLQASFCLKNPRHRWIGSRWPSINPAFAIAETIWIIMGENESAFLNYWNSKLPEYAGKDRYYYGAYGYRLINNFNINQIEKAFHTLKHNPTSRQVVLQIWDPKLDFPLKKGKPRNTDIPCNLLSVLRIVNGKLFWTQILRSNDLFLGVPYNIIQFTFIQEMLASWLNVELGNYFHLSNSLHVYDRDVDKIEKSLLINKSICQNSDIFNLNKSETYKKFKELHKKAIFLSKKEASCESIKELSNWSSAPKLLQNYLYVLCAEACRKRKKNDEADELINRCDNKCLKKIWINWKNRWME